jgi:hypothetical protein
MIAQQNSQSQLSSTDPGRRQAMPDPQTPPKRAASAFSKRSLLVSLVVTTLLPLILYSRLGAEVHSQTMLLVIAGAVPVAWTLGKLAVRRQVDPIGLLSVAGFALGLLLVFLTGGSAFAFKVREPAITAALGLICLASLALRRPVALPFLRRSGRSFVSDAARRAAAYRLTAIGGITLTLQGAAVIMLAATVSTRTFLAVHQPLGLAILGLGFAVLLWSKHRNAAPQSGEREPDGQS